MRHFLLLTVMYWVLIECLTACVTVRYKPSQEVQMKQMRTAYYAGCISATCSNSCSDKGTEICNTRSEAYYVYLNGYSKRK